MKKSALVCRIAAAMIILAPAVAFAAEHDNEGGQTSDRTIASAGCDSLMYQFDALHTKNAAALALRKKAGNNCANVTWNSKQDGINQMKTALRMVGQEPLL